MGKEELSGRDIWQDYSGEHAGIAEHRFYNVFDNEFAGTNFRIVAKPNEFKDIYVNVELPPEELRKIYTPAEPIVRHGIVQLLILKPINVFMLKSSGKTAGLKESPAVPDAATLAKGLANYSHLSKQ